MITWAIALAVIGLAAWPSLAHADHITVPPVPSNIQAPAGKPFLVGHAVGTQNYICLPVGSGFTWTFFGPQATLLNDDSQQIITHFLSPNPVGGGYPPRHVAALPGHEHRLGKDDRGVLRSRLRRLGGDSVAFASGSWSPGRSHWWRPVVGDHLHPAAEYNGRSGARDGVRPGHRCRRQALVPYTADYFFYKAAKKHANDSTDEDSVRSPSPEPPRQDSVTDRGPLSLSSPGDRDRPNLRALTSSA